MRKQVLDQQSVNDIPTDPKALSASTFSFLETRSQIASIRPKTRLPRGNFDNLRHLWCSETPHGHHYSTLYFKLAQKISPLRNLVNSILMDSNVEVCCKALQVPVPRNRWRLYGDPALSPKQKGLRLTDATPCFLIMVPKRGLEPRRPKALPPQDSVSTSFTTSAGMRLISSYRPVWPAGAGAGAGAEGTTSPPPAAGGGLKGTGAALCCWSMRSVAETPSSDPVS